MGPQFYIATGVFCLVYVLIISDKIHKTILSLFGAAMMIVSGIITQEEAFYSIDLGVDWNVIFLLISMMVMINIMKPTGVFEYIAVKSAKLAKGEPFRIMVIFSVITALLSSLLDNVTTVLLITPVTILIDVRGAEGEDKGGQRCFFRENGAWMPEPIKMAWMTSFRISMLWPFFST